MEILIKGHEAVSQALIENTLYHNQVSADYILGKIFHWPSGEFDIISFTNTGYQLPGFVKIHCKDVLHLEVDDIDFPRKTQVAPSKLIVEQCLTFAANREKLICCCHQGISRSSATAYLIAAKEWGPKQALTILKLHKHYPNRLIVHLGSEILNNPEIWSTYVEWQKDAGVDPGEKGNWPKTS